MKSKPVLLINNSAPAPVDTATAYVKAAAVVPCSQPPTAEDISS